LANLNRIIGICEKNLSNNTLPLLKRMKSQENYKYQYTWDSKYCYPDSQVLKNKLNIRDAELLQNIERDITSIAVQELMEYPIQGNFDLDHLKAINRALFQDIYSWAGELRTVNISKGSSFCNWPYIESNARALFSELKQEEYLQDTDESELPQRLAYYFSEINAIHPFREGNGRTQRLFIEYLANALGYHLQFSLISTEQMIIASVESFNGNMNHLEELFYRVLQR
jgi:cell filamentation protein